MNVSFGEVYVEHIKIDRSSNGVMYEPSKRNEGKKLLDHYAVHFFNTTLLSTGMIFISQFCPQHMDYNDL